MIVVSSDGLGWLMLAVLAIQIAGAVWLLALAGDHQRSREADLAARVASIELWRDHRSRAARAHRRTWAGAWHLSTPHHQGDTQPCTTSDGRSARRYSSSSPWSR